MFSRNMVEHPSSSLRELQLESSQSREQSEQGSVGQQSNTVRTGVIWSQWGTGGQSEQGTVRHSQTAVWGKIISQENTNSQTEGKSQCEQSLCSGSSQQSNMCVLRHLSFLSAAVQSEPDGRRPGGQRPIVFSAAPVQLPHAGQKVATGWQCGRYDVMV